MKSKKSGRDLVKLRETVVFRGDSAQQLTEEQIKQRNYPVKLTEAVQDVSTDQVVAAAMKLMESLTGDSDKQLLKKVIERLTEVGVGKRKVWRLPVTKMGVQNANGRTYGRKLWENVRDFQKDVYLGSTGLVDHPEKDDDPGKFRDQGIVWHDFEVPSTGDVAYGYGSFVGPLGMLAQDILEVGGKVGTSSSGFGDVDPITKEVDPDTFILERLADLVLNPSQGTYATIECAHGPDDFMKEPLGGAEISYQRPTAIHEAAPKSNIIKEKMRMAELDAAKLAEKTEGEAAPAKKSAISRAEEKMFRKYIETFISEANKIANPLKRLNECVDVLNLFDEGVAPDLKEKFQEQVLIEKKNLEELVEDATAVHNEVGVDVGTLKENALKIAAEGATLKEQVIDYEELCEELTQRIHRLNEENKRLKRGVHKKERVVEKVLTEKTKVLVGTQGKLDAVSTEAHRLTERIEALKETNAKLTAGNKALEKENGLLSTKLKEAAGIVSKGRNLRERVGAIADDAADENEKLREEIKSLKEALADMTKRRAFQIEQNERLKEEYAAYKKMVEVDNNPSVHVMPRADKRIGKFIDLRENQGRDVQEYWDDLCDRYTEEVMKPFEASILGAKTLREATRKFLENRLTIDPEFKAGASINDFPMRTTADRVRYLESQGAAGAVYDASKVSVEQLNDAFSKRLAAAGLR